MEVGGTNAHFLNQDPKQFTKLKIPQMSKRLPPQTSYKNCLPGTGRRPRRTIPFSTKGTAPSETALPLVNTTGDSLPTNLVPGFYNMAGQIKYLSNPEEIAEWLHHKITDISCLNLKQQKLDFDQETQNSK